MLSPIEVKKYEFSRSMRGYNVDEVRNFLETIAEDLERLEEVKRKQAIELDQVKVEVATFQRIEQNMKDALVNAQEALRGTREDSRREAELLKREAKIEAEGIFRDAYNRAEKIKQEIEELVAKRDGFVRKWRNVLRSELEMLTLLDEIENEKKQDAQSRSLNSSHQTESEGNVHE